MSDEKYELISNDAENRQLLEKGDKCDKFDYITAVACGVIGGMIDIFLVGSPGASKLGDWTDKQVDSVVMSFARKLGWKPSAKNAGNVRSAIGFLEHGNADFPGFRVNYDQRLSSDVGNQFDIAPSTHHMMSLGHSPDIIGLFFSVLNQFTNTASFIANGQLVTVVSEPFQLIGGNFLMKIMCGIANWFGHLMSDVAGSSGSHGRGTGIVMPFYELFGFCKFGSFSTDKGKKDLAEIATQAFTQGYDFRFGLAQAIPVAITELSIRLIWSIRRHFQYGKPIKECIPSAKHAELRVMILLGNGTLCVMDGFDATARSGGNFLAFFMRLNLLAWFRFTTLVLKEVFIRVGFPNTMQETLEAFKRINAALLEYLKELEKIDIEQFERETEEYNRVIKLFDKAESEEDVIIMLMDIYEQLGIEKPWKGKFNDFMENKNETLVFK